MLLKENLIKSNIYGGAALASLKILIVLKTQREPKGSLPRKILNQVLLNKITS